MFQDANLHRAVRLLGACSVALTLMSAAQAQDSDWLRLDREAVALSRQGNSAQALIVATQALSAAEKAFGPNHLNVAQCLSRIADLHRDQGQLSQAEPLYRRSIAIQEKHFGADNSIVGVSLSELAKVYKTLGQYAKAEALHRRALAITVKARGPMHSDVATNLSNLATLYFAQGQYAQAEKLYRQALAINLKTVGPQHAHFATDLHNLAELLHATGRYVQAESMNKQAIAIFEKTRGPDHLSVALTLNSLAGLYRTVGRYELALPLYKRALAIMEAHLNPFHPDIATGLHNLAAMHQFLGQDAQVEAMLNRAKSIMERAGPDTPNLATILASLALLHETQGRPMQAEPLYRRALAIRESVLGADHPDVATSLFDLAGLHQSQGRLAQAVPLFQRSLAIREKSLGPDNPHVSFTLTMLAGVNDLQGKGSQALALARRASAIHRQRIIAGGTSHAAVREAARNRSGFLVHLSLLSRNPDNEPADRITDESLQVAQMSQASGTASAVAKMASRFATGDDALASLVKRKQDAIDRRDRAETQLVNAASRPSTDRHAETELRLREEINAARAEVRSVDAELARDFPEYRELARPEPITISQAQSLMRPGEAMVVYALDSQGFIWVMKKDSAVFLPLKTDVKGIASKVARIRSQMELDATNRLKRVSVATLHDLYQHLFAPALPHLAGVKHVMVVPGGPLQSLPFGMLVASPPPDINSETDYRQVDWLARHYAFSVLPSVSSIQALRQFAKTPAVREPFAGFGDPLIGNPADAAGGQRGIADIAAIFRRASPTGGALQAADVADVEAVRRAPRLPETAAELRALAKVLQSDEKSLWLQANATETRIKQMDLSRYRTIAFATHGVMAGEIEGIGEPGLILTPPPRGTPDDDGYLSAGEIARLKLNADWVILSACNTAATDGTPGAEGLSGLAKAFFYAGARSLLVSHWPVASEATVPLTTEMLKEYEANQDAGKAEAQRKAMLRLINTSNHPEYAHPLFWAPFVVVGEGGAGPLATSTAGHKNSK